MKKDRYLSQHHKNLYILAMEILEVVRDIFLEVMTVLYFALPLSKKHLYFKAGIIIVFILSKSSLPFFESKTENMGILKVLLK